MATPSRLLASAALAGTFAGATPAEPARNVVLVHGAFTDGSGWRGVCDELTSRGYAVCIVPDPLTSLADDIAATHRVLARQDGPVILVGHSYGGSVITEAGAHPKVVGLVYVAACAPEVGQSTLDRYAIVPPPPDFVLEEQSDGFAFLNAQRFRAGSAGTTSEADPAFLHDSQVPVAMAALGAPVTIAAWQPKPSRYVPATEDGAIAPEFHCLTAERIGAEIAGVRGSHVVFLTQPREMAEAIDTAAMLASRAGRVRPAEQAAAE